MSGKSDFQLVSVSEEFYFSLVGKSENPPENVWLLQVLASAWASLCLDEGSGGQSLPVAFVSCFLLHVWEGMLTLPCLHPIAWGRGQLKGRFAYNLHSKCSEINSAQAKSDLRWICILRWIPSRLPNTPCLRAPLPATFLPVLNAP